MILARTLALLIAASSPLAAQSLCGAPNVTLTVTPSVAAPGEPIEVVLTNNSTDQLTAGGCLITGVFPDVSCNSTSIYPFFCPLILQIIDPGQTATDTWTQINGMGVPVSAGTYSLQVTYSNDTSSFQCCVPITIAEPELCFGDGGDQMGCTSCPCGNDAPVGSGGGCQHSQSAALFSSAGAVLQSTGSASLGASDLCFSMIQARPDSFGILTSSTTIAPANPANPCFAQNPGSGVTSATLDGLRCVVQGVLRHGSRAILADGTAGVSSNGWGDCSPGFPNSSGFLAGEARFFQVIYRDEPELGCGTAQNTTQAVRITFAP